MRSINPVGNQQPPFCPSGSADIDAARRAVAASPTGEEDVQRRRHLTQHIHMFPTLSEVFEA